MILGIIFSLSRSLYHFRFKIQILPTDLIFYSHPSMWLLLIFLPCASQHEQNKVAEEKNDINSKVTLLGIVEVFCSRLW
jgi:hypothetical protein